MSAKAFAVVTDNGVMFVDRQLLIFPRHEDAQRGMARLLDRDDINVEQCRIERVTIVRREEMK